MENPVVLISGATGNLGSAVCSKYLSEGYAVAALDSHGSAPKLAGAKGIRSFPADLRSEEEVSRVMKDVEAEFRAISAAVLTVGGFAMGTISDTGTGEIEKMIRLNFITAYNVTRELLGIMNAGSQLVFIGAGPAVHPSSAASMFAYGLSKSMLVYLSRVINADMKEKDISAAVIIPGIIDTPQNRRSMPDADHSAWQSPEQLASRIFSLHTEEGRSGRDRIIEI